MKKGSKAIVQNSKLVGDTAAQAEWLHGHIPHRIRAAMAHSTTEMMLALLHLKLSEQRAAFSLRSASNAIWEGRPAALRWLIEFVGIKCDKNGDPKSADYMTSFDLRITDLTGGRSIDPKTVEARVLAKVWLGCSQATGHPTHQSNHPPINDIDRTEALGIIMRHLQDTIYAEVSESIQDQVLGGPAYKDADDDLLSQKQ